MRAHSCDLLSFSKWLTTFKFVMEVELHIVTVKFVIDVYATKGRENKKKMDRAVLIRIFVTFQSAPTPELLTDWVSVLRQAMQMKSFERRKSQLR